MNRWYLSSQGEAMITYEDPQAAKAAIDWFNGEFHKCSGTCLSPSVALDRC